MNFKYLNDYRYFNGNYIVHGSFYKKFFRLEKRALRLNEELISEFPDSIDLKITNKCNYGCPYCHESSIKDGKSFDLEKTKSILSQLPRKPIEIAIGGGNVVECLNDLEKLTEWLSSRNHLPRITLNLKDVLGNAKDPKNYQLCSIISKNIESVGISLESLDFLDNIKKHNTNNKRISLRSSFLINFSVGYNIETSSYVVFHIIAGIFPSSQLRNLIKNSGENGILVLGYKQWGRAKNTALPDMTEWKKEIKYILENEKVNIGFDNLACEQLDIKNIIGENIWKTVYLGDEGSCSMYIDAVNGEFARTSRSPERVDWNTIGLLDYYASLRK